MQASTVVRLIAGKSYYIEGVESNSEGSNSLSVGVQLPNGLVLRPITGEFLNRAPDAAAGSSRNIDGKESGASYSQAEFLTSSQTGGGGVDAGGGGGGLGLGSLGELNPSEAMSKAPLGFVFPSVQSGILTFFNISATRLSFI